jgi:hypothetical protein
VATPPSTFIARFMSPIVSAIVVAEILPARSLSSTASLNRVKMFVGGACRSAYLDSRNSR